MSNTNTYKGKCFCGAVQFTVSVEPTAMGYCHCESCRHWSAGPVNAFTLWKLEAVIPDLSYQPGIHVHYQEIVLRIKDGLQKMKDVPKEIGGAGTAVAESFSEAAESAA